MKKILVAAFFTFIVTIPALAADKAEIKKFYEIDQQAYAKNNVLVAAYGLIAPADVKDSYDWALKLIQEDLKTHKLAEQLKTMPNKLVPSIVGKADGLGCWLGRKAGEAGKKEGEKKCYTKQEVQKFAEDNKLFMSRFAELSNMQRFVDLPAHNVGAQELISGEKLYLANMIINAEQKREAVLQQWLAHVEAVRKWNADQGSLVERSVTLVLYGLVEKQLPAILNDDEALAEKYKPDLAHALAPYGPKQMNITLAMKTDFQIMKEIFETLGETSMKNVYALHQDLIALSNQPASKFEEENKKFTTRYEALNVPKETEGKFMERMEKPGKEPLSAKERDEVGNLLIKEVSVSSSMIGTMNMMDANTRMHNIYAQVRANKLAKDKIADFIKSAPPEMQDPFSGKTFNYNPATNTISSDCANMYSSPAPVCVLSLD